MKKLSFITLASMAGLMIQTSCTKEETPVQEQCISLFASANIEETAESKAYINNNQNGQKTAVDWNSSDKIAVFKAEGGDKIQFAYNKTAKNFQGKIDGKPAVAAYPNSQIESFDGTTFTAIIPSDEKVSNPASFSTNGTLMFGNVSDSTGSYTTQFRHICGFVKFYAPDEAVKKVTLTAKETLVGKVNVTLDEKGYPTTTLVADDPANSNTVSLSILHGGSMYMWSVLPGTYSELSVTVEYFASSGKTARTFTSSKTLTVNKGETCILGVLPICNNIVSLDFADNNQLYQGTDTKTYLPITKVNKTETFKLDCTIDGNPTTLEFELGVVSGSDSKTGWFYNNKTDKAQNGLILNQVGSYLKLPTIAGKKVVMLKLSESNGSGKGTKEFQISTDGTIKAINQAVITVQGYANTPNHTYWSAQVNNDYNATRNVYIYCNSKSSNSMLRTLDIYYTDNFNYTNLSD